MKTKIIFITLNLLLSVIISNIEFLPWWSFLVMSFFMGLIYTKREKNINSFICGFVSGFANWFLASLFFHVLYEGILMEKVSSILLVPTFILFAGIGVISGILNGLACYSGYSLFVAEDTLDLN